ncbi:MAG: hypothetical protein KDD35_05200, partial [Bdellovibrionales bacterium]|nr:hypothetical protein [Bdellovibrionales bacterium]
MGGDLQDRISTIRLGVFACLLYFVSPTLAFAANFHFQVLRPYECSQNIRLSIKDQVENMVLLTSSAAPRR